MLGSRFLILTSLLALPLAAAGGYDASVDYLEPGPSGCETYSWSHSWQYPTPEPPRNNTTEPSPSPSTGWGYDSGSNTHCYDSFTYGSASVSDEDGRIASFGSGSSHSSSDQRSWSLSNWEHPSGSSRHDGTSASNHTSASRHANLSTREGSVGVFDGCSSSSSGYRTTSTWTWSGNESGRSSASHWESESSQESCRTTVSAHRDGKTYAVNPRESGCERSRSYGGSHDSWSDANGSGSQSWHNGASTDACRTGASAQADDQRVAAGLVDRCEGWSYDQERPTSNGSESFQYQTHSCQDGLLVEGPDGIVVFLGDESAASQGCSTYEGQPSCYDSQEARTFLLVAWAHSPLGPAPVYVPLA